jgi:hypothetical protein
MSVRRSERRPFRSWPQQRALILLRCGAMTQC